MGWCLLYVYCGPVVRPPSAAFNSASPGSVAPGMGATIRSLAKLGPRRLALMHGPSFAGDGAAALRALADEYERRTLDRRAVLIEAKAA